ncbi:MAG: alpha-amylase [Bacteroidaceae bacterium]|nr:alpha-amylase [Bacteroidaceae bacterium]
MSEKIVIYQVFTRLFGNDRRTCVPNGDKKTNGCGRMDAFSSHALHQIRALGATHIWYTGIIEHASQTDYTMYGIPADNGAMVKGRAGSPYAIRDYYDIDPDLATSVPARMHEFEQLVERTHAAGLKMIIDFVPNHVARQYHSDKCPADAEDLGASDNVTLAFSPNNNFYYIPGDTLHAHDFDLLDYQEHPAKVTGNDQFTSWIGRNDWYETVKLNYGVDYLNGRTTHFDPIPQTWKKMLHILLYWAAKGIDGFRCDMAEMVPVEFWCWAITQVKAHCPNIDFIAEVYNPAEYRNYLQKGHFDYLYDKVGMYDCLRAVVCGQGQACDITTCWQSTDDIRQHMLYFLENHDEQRLASDFFAGNAEAGRPALIVAACMGSNPMMIYFGQELGERGMDVEGYSGRDGRTTIFDYWMVDSIRRWRNRGKFDNRQLTPFEVSLQQYYSRVLSLCNTEPALREGVFHDLMYVNPRTAHFNPTKHYAFLRKHGDEVVLVVVNFGAEDDDVEINIPAHVFEALQIPEMDNVMAEGLLSGCPWNISFCSKEPVRITVPANNGRILKIKTK